MFLILNSKGLVATCHSFLRFIFLSDDTLQDITSQIFFYMMRQAFMRGAAVVSHGSHHIVVMRLGQVRF